MRAPKKLVKKLGISAASLLLLLVASELVLRALEPGPFSFFDSHPYRHHPDNALVARHKPDFAGRWDGTWYGTNSQGFRGPELELDFGEDEFRVVCVGDSCTFGKAVKESESWPRQLETMMRAEANADWRPVVANLGVNGYSGKTYELIFREEGVPLKPHLVALGYNLNDFPNVIEATDKAVFGQRGLRRAIPTGVRDWMGRFALYRQARATYYHLNRERDWKNAESFAAGTASQDLDSEVWRKQRAFLSAIKSQVDALDSKLAVFLFPYESQVYLDSFDTTPIDRLREICHQLDIPFVDLAAEFRARAREMDPAPSLFLRGDRYHPNAEGYRIVAESVLQVVRGHSWLPQ
jgi:lysophospholipase L1-like esterase